MKTSAIVLILVCPFFVTAQYFTGSYTSQPALASVDEVVVDHPSELDGKYGELISFQFKQGSSTTVIEDITTISGKDAKKVIKKYGADLEVLSVHRISVVVDGNEWSAYMLGYMDEGANGNFLMVKEIKDNSDTVQDIRMYDLAKSDRYIARSAYNAGDR